MGRPGLDQLLELATQEFIHSSSEITWCLLGITCSWVVLLLLLKMQGGKAALVGRAEDWGKRIFL